MGTSLAAIVSPHVPTILVVRDRARAAGIDIPQGYRATVLDRMAAGSAHLPSMARDVRGGRPTEITQLNEQIAVRGRELGVATPTHDAILDLVRVFDWRARSRA